MAGWSDIKTGKPNITYCSSFLGWGWLVMGVSNAFLLCQAYPMKVFMCWCIVKIKIH